MTLGGVTIGTTVGAERIQGSRSDRNSRHSQLQIDGKLGRAERRCSQKTLATRVAWRQTLAYPRASFVPLLNFVRPPIFVQPPPLHPPLLHPPLFVQPSPHRLLP
jgi:hypothetical protein